MARELGELKELEEPGRLSSTLARFALGIAWLRFGTHSLGTSFPFPALTALRPSLLRFLFSYSSSAPSLPLLSAPSLCLLTSKLVIPSAVVSLLSGLGS